MKKKRILFVTTRSPFSKIFSGDRQRAKTIINHLNKKNKLEIIYSDNFDEKGKTKIKSFFYKRRFIDKIKGILSCLIEFRPLQLGYFYSDEIFKFLKFNHQNYDTIIFHLIRSAQYLPKDFTGKRLLEMTDLISKNYNQIINSISIFNPLKYIYLFEKILVKRYENYCEDYFDKIVLASKNDIKNTNIKEANKFIEIPNTTKKQKRIYSYKKSNCKVLFLGNLNYFPNKKACKKFSKIIMPKLNKIYPNLEFHIIGEIKILDKIFFNSLKKTYVHGPVKNIDSHIKNSICGVCNVDIATGTQMKILSYISYGLPCISSLQSFNNTFFKKGKEVLVYKNDNDFVKLIIKLKESKTFSNQISKASYSGFLRKYDERRLLSTYDKII
tara:strand:+ start:11281 stop:12432 length:1152 start_codon:yes stop_codon:yes gene_type:complete